MARDARRRGMDSALRSIADLPGPRGLPLIGNAHQLARTSRVHLAAERWARRYGPIVRVDIGRRRIVGISDADEIHRILRERPQGFRRWRDQEIVARENARRGPPGGVHRRGRGVEAPAPLVVTALNTNHLHRYFHVDPHQQPSGCTGAWPRLRAPEERWRSSRELTSYTVDIISALAFGHDLNTLERGENELQADIQRSARDDREAPGDAGPLLALDRLPADRALDRSIAEMHRAQEGFIAQAVSGWRSGRSC